ncbi:tumor suppressor ARF-like [Erethizon dorsatum]
MVRRFRRFLVTVRIRRASGSSQVRAFVVQIPRRAGECAAPYARVVEALLLMLVWRHRRGQQPYPRRPAIEELMGFCSFTTWSSLKRLGPGSQHVGAPCDRSFGVVPTPPNKHTSLLRRTSGVGTWPGGAGNAGGGGPHYCGECLRMSAESPGLQGSQPPSPLYPPPGP